MTSQMSAVISPSDIADSLETLYDDKKSIYPNSYAQRDVTILVSNVNQSQPSECQLSKVSKYCSQKKWEEIETEVCQTGLILQSTQSCGPPKLQNQKKYGHTRITQPNPILHPISSLLLPNNVNDRLCDNTKSPCPANSNKEETQTAGRETPSVNLD